MYVRFVLIPIFFVRRSVVDAYMSMHDVALSLSGSLRRYNYAAMSFGFAIIADADATKCIGDTLTFLVGVTHHVDGCFSFLRNKV
ncbi:hypothetical protein E2P86_11050 [Sphingobacterium psychroaquaticum]|uniref:hypothetical protein n=1 Tax=Sphingobacterium psychroaquaticum TaxID=561061 RepID=UPI00106D0EDC|nr:hypothetical protein [Sphingobacterium psychroaquaticum]QBQ41654.1 hypothetical protein E2P86_11050 [Sphingobacterium psychroaquaticum]